jgi:Asp/Glu/hydantoin racemase
MHQKSDLSPKDVKLISPQKSGRYLLINPNTNSLTTQRLREVLLPKLPQNASLAFSTAAFGASYIACEASHAVAAHACIGAWADYVQQHPEHLDGVLIGCFGDPGLFALREMASCPVTGLAEASFIQAAAHGPFSIVTGGERWKPMLHRLAVSLGYGHQLRHIETVVPSGAELQANPQMAIECLHTACQNASLAGVQSIILGGAGLAGYAAQIQSLVKLPIIDSATAGLEVLIQQQAPRTAVKANSTFASWTSMAESIQALKPQ